MAWVFQGNPKKFDIDAYVIQYPELVYWSTPRYQSRITIGDRAFIWRSGESAGAIAIGVVVEPPTAGSAVRYPEALGRELWRTEEPDLSQPRTGIRIQEVRPASLVEEEFLSRELVAADPILANSLLMKMPTGTVFPLDEEETMAMERLWGLAGSRSLSTGVSEGDRQLIAHYRREKSRSLRTEKLGEVKKKNGRYVCDLCGMDHKAAYPEELVSAIFEVHHRVPLSRSMAPVRTTLDDLAVLCANCHRAVHATPDVETNYEELAERLAQRHR